MKREMGRIGGLGGLSALACAACVACIACVACGDSEECTELKAILAERKAVLQTARAQAGALDIVEKRSTASESNASKLLRSLWLNEPETKIHETLEKRAKAIPGATMERGTNVSGDEQQPGEAPESETMWTVRFHDASMEHAFTVLDMLLSNPPLVRFSAIIHDRARDDWRVELIRATVDQVPITPHPIPIAPPKDLGAIPKKFGFCGAGALRSQINDVDAQIRGVKDRAEKTTVLLPASASWEGLRQRAEVARDKEMESRRHLKLFKDLVVATGVPLKAVGVEGAMVFLEVWGGPRERARIGEEALRRGVVEQLQTARNAPEGVVRVMLPNTVEESHRVRPQQQNPQNAPQNQPQNAPQNQPQNPAQNQPQKEGEAPAP